MPRSSILSPLHRRGERKEKHARRKILAAHDDSDLLHCTLFPGLRWEKDASQPSGCQEVFFVATHMLVLVYL